MTRRPLFVLVGLIAVLGLGAAGLWILTQKSASPALESDKALVEAAAPQPKPSDSAAIEATPDAGGPERKLVEKASVAAKSGSSTTVLTPLEAELKNATWVEGKVRLPDGTPPDEKIVIEARGKKFSNDALHSAEVARDGSYRVAFSQGTRTGWLRLKGRYSYLPEDQKVKLPSKAGASIDPVELTPLLGGWIRGHVVLPLGVTSQDSSLAGTSVQAYRMMYEPGDENNARRNIAGEIGADERFELGGVPGKSGWSLSIDAVAFTRTQKNDIKAENGKAVDVEITLKTGARLAGQVVDEDGKPVAEASFFYQAPNEPSGDGWTNYHGKKTGVDGNFDLRGTPAAKGTLTVEKEGFLKEKLPFASLAEGSAQQGLRVVLRRGNGIAGTVHWPEGGPAAGASVSLRFTPEKQEENEGFSFFGGNEQSTKADAEGKFHFTGLARGTAVVRAEAKAPAGKPGADSKAVEAAASSTDEPAAENKPDAAAPEQPAEAKKPAQKGLKGRKWTAIQEDVQAGTQNLQLTLNAGYSIEGRVVNSAGEPFKEFLVRAEPVDKTRNEWESVRGAVTGRFSDEAGRFTLEGLHEGEWKLRAEAKNAPACTPQQIHVPGQNGALVLTLAAGCSVSGVVVDPKGAPVRGARVRADPENDASSSFVFNLNKNFSATTGAEGKFELGGIPPGPMKLAASCDEWAAAETQKLDLVPGQKLEGLQLVMRTPGRIVGLVLDRAGHIDGGRPVSMNGGENGSWHQTTSDSNGRFEFEKLAPGEYHVYTQAKQEEFAAASGDQTRVNRVWQEQQRTLQVTVTEGATTEITLGGLPKNALHLVGHVTCGGRPVANAYLQAWKQQRTESDESQDFHAAAADDGSFDLVLGGAGEYSVNVNADASGASTSISFQVKIGSEPQQTHDFELPGARIAGRVVDRAGKPQPQVALQLSTDSKARGEQRGPGVNGNVTTDDQGRFVFEHVAPGTYEIVCGGQNYGWRQGARTGRSTRSGLVVEPGKSLEGIEIVAQPPCHVEGIVTGPDGAPVAGATVLVVDEQGKSLVGWERETTDATGRFSFDALPPVRASFLAQKGLLSSGFSGWVTIQESDSTKADLALVNSSMVFVQALDGSGASVQADIQIFDSHGFDVSMRSGELPASVAELPGWRFGPLAPGKYSVVVMRKDKPDVRQEFSAGGEPSLAVNVRCD